MSRPEITIDWNVVNELLEAGCIGTEIAASIGMHPETFYDRVVKEFRIGFTEYATQKRAKGNSILRKVQFDVATKDKDKTMLVWLGKQRLDQREPDSKTVEECKPALKEYLERLNKTAAEYEKKEKLLDNSPALENTNVDHTN